MTHSFPTRLTADLSQLSRVARNAERQAEKPEFRADMVATLQSSVGKMNDLLARLAQHNKGRTDERVAVPLGRLLEALARDKRKAHPVLLDVRQIGSASCRERVCQYV